MKFGYIGLFFTVLTCASAFADPNPYKIVTSKAYVDTKQTKVPAGTDGALVTHSGTDGTFGTPRAVATSLGSDTAATSVPTSGAVVSGFNTKFPANGGTDKVVTLGATAGAPSSKNIVSTVTGGGTNIPTDGAVFSAVAGKANKPTCTLTKPGDSSICYAWTFAGCAAYDESVSSASECCSGVTYTYVSGKFSYLRCGCASASDCPSGTPDCSDKTHQCDQGKI